MLGVHPNSENNEIIEINEIDIFFAKQRNTLQWTGVNGISIHLSTVLTTD
jgi:hypothetical protein